MIIAIDGPAASGKSSTADAVARRLGFRHLESGAFYRAVTYAAMRRRIPPAEWDSLDGARLDALDITVEPADTGFRLRVDGRDVSEEIRAAEVNANVSTMARVPAVRAWLLDTLRATARDTDLVADGRDIGTVVFPDADLKVFIVAAAETRARRRLIQMGMPLDSDTVAEEVRRIEERDRIDSSRAVAPLKRAADAVLLDTTHLTFDEQVERIVEMARARMRAR
ncbi:MAG TPA: (d)CMP kinase [Longimicrobiales bacterium]